MSRYFWNILIWVDQGVNVLLAPLLNLIFRIDGFGDPDETLSSVFGKYSGQCVMCYRICKILHWIDKGHCEKSIEIDEGKGL